VAAVNTDAEPVASPEDTRRQEVADLLVRAQHGDRSALDVIISRMMPLVWNVARAQSLDPDTASDVVQNVWLQLLQHFAEIHTPRALAGWLVTVTRREACRVRAAQRSVEPMEPENMVGLPDEDDGSGHLVEVQDQYQCLWRNMRSLSPRCQEVLRVVAYVDRPDYSTVSQILGMPKGSIGPTRGRCLAHLRRLLRDDPAWSLR